VSKTNVIHQEHIAPTIHAQSGSMMLEGHVTGLAQKPAVNTARIMYVIHQKHLCLALQTRYVLQAGKLNARPMLHAQHGIYKAKKGEVNK